MFRNFHVFEYQQFSHNTYFEGHRPGEADHVLNVLGAELPQLTEEFLMDRHLLRMNINERHG